MPGRTKEALHRGGYAAVGRHTLEHERDGFAGFMGRLSERLGRPGPDGTLDKRST